MPHRPSPEPFEGERGTHFVHDRSTDSLLVTTAQGGEAQIPAGDFWSFVDVAQAGSAGGRALSLDGLLEEVLQLAPELWPRVLEVRERRPSVHLVLDVLDRARLAAYRDPEEAQRLVEFAEFLTGDLDRTPGAAVWGARLRARASAVRGHCLRLAGRLDEATSAFGRAREAGSGPDPALDALEMLLCFDLRHYGPAEIRASRAAAAFAACGDFERAALALFFRSALKVIAGDLTTALEHLLAAAHLVDPEDDPVAAMAVEEAFTILAPRRPQLQATAPPPASLRRVTDLEASYPHRPDAREAVEYLRNALWRYDNSRRLLRRLAADTGPLAERTA